MGGADMNEAQINTALRDACPNVLRWDHINHHWLRLVWKIGSQKKSETPRAIHATAIQRAKTLLLGKVSYQI